MRRVLLVLAALAIAVGGLAVPAEGAQNLSAAQVAKALQKRHAFRQAGTTPKPDMQALNAVASANSSFYLVVLKRPLAGASNAKASARLLVVLVMSHWVLDFVSHAPDMPLWPGASPAFGLGLWNSIPATYLVEGAIWLGAIVLYLSARPLRGWKSHLAFWSFTGVSTLMWAAGPFGPPPLSAQALALFALIGWTTVPWAYAADRRAPARHH